MILEDLKYRAITWILFPIFFCFSGYLHYINSIPEIFFMNCMMNLILVLLVIGLTFLYTKLKMKINFLSEAFGLGDILFFTGMAVAFPTITFVILFCSTCVFSLCLHLALNFINNSDTGESTIPLAGYSSILLILIYIINFLGFNSIIFLT